MAIGKKRILAIALFIMLFGSASSTFHPAEAQVLTIRIRPDGSITGTEGTDDIERDGNTYIIRNDINRSIWVEASNIVLDGQGHVMQGIGNGTGLKLHCLDDNTNCINVTIKDLNIRNFKFGASFSGSTRCTLTNCTITDCYQGINFLSSYYNSFYDNTFRNNTLGVELVFATNNVFAHNSFEGDSQPIWCEYEWINYFDSSNLVDGLPVYYFVNQKDLLIDPSTHPQIGYLALINCTGATVRNIDHSNSAYGIILVQTTNSTVTKNKLANNWCGIYGYASTGNNFTENILDSNDSGIFLIDANSTNAFLRNNFTNNKLGIYVSGANQIIYHNNFINNSKNAEAPEWTSLNFYPSSYGSHTWDGDHSLGGNYWSDYNSTDNNDDGFGDNSYTVSSFLANIDHYPIMQPIDITIPFPPSPSPTLIPTLQPSSTPTLAPITSPTSSPTLYPDPTETPKPNKTSQNQGGFLGTNLPTEYGYAIAATLVILFAAVGVRVYFKKHRK